MTSTVWEDLCPEALDDAEVIVVRVTVSGLGRQEALDSLQEALESIPEMISVYEMLPDGAGGLVPDCRPLA